MDLIELVMGGMAWNGLEEQNEEEEGEEFYGEKEVEL